MNPKKVWWDNKDVEKGTNRGARELTGGKIAQMGQVSNRIFPNEIRLHACKQSFLFDYRQPVLL